MIHVSTWWRRWRDRHPLTDQVLQLVITALVVSMLIGLALIFHFRYVQPYVVA
jgi:hypothetical protein